MNYYPRLIKGKYFSLLVLKNAYLQIPVDEESQKYLVINTHKELCKLNRLPFGHSSSPAIFQMFTAGLLLDVDGVGAYLGDMIINEEAEEEHDLIFSKVLDILQEHNTQINKKKSAVKVSSLEYLGYHISSEGVRSSAIKASAISDAPSPTSVAEVQSFLGVVTYYCKFIQNFSNKCAPLYDVLKKNANFKWSKIEQTAFETVKKDFAESPLLSNYDGKVH
ncbi:uncharacterized protein [Macrobrachium rosenbergii]|uniref:uncharacterized protein n=1 Tax=Macrobrachium rosenbergii TaxID=79674 RepID=UPI0034D6EDB1